MPMLSTSPPTLDLYLRSTNQSDSNRILTQLFEQVIEPQIRRLVRKKLNVTLQAADDRQINQNALDLLGDIRTSIITRLTQLRSEPNTRGIDDLEGYVRAVAVNEINHQLRRKYPRRLRLKNQLRYILEHHAGFELWTSEDGELHCRRSSVAAPERAAGVVISFDNLRDLAGKAVDASPRSIDGDDVLFPLLLIFEQLDSTVRVRDLVTVIYDILRISEPAEVSEEHGQFAVHSDQGPQGRLEQLAFVRHVWSAVIELPVRHRTALLLNLRDDGGDSLLRVLPAAGIASLSEIAEKLELTADRFARIWHDLPWDDNTIAEHLGLSRQQVINLRQSARATLRRRLHC